MADVRGAWNDAGNQLTELGRKLKAHYEQQHGADSQESKEELADAVHRIGGAVQDAFEALGSAARDREVQSDVRQAGQSLFEALGATLGQASGEIKRAFGERKGDAATAETEIAETEPATTVTKPAPVTEPVDTATEKAAEVDGEEAPPPPGVEPWGTP
jgi:predicted small metal-binding protein